MKGTILDLTAEAAGASTRRPGRSALTSLGTVLGTGALVTTLGLAATAQAQISARFDALRATQVSLRDSTGSIESTVGAASGEERLRALNGVQAVGTTVTARDPLPVSTLPPSATSGSAQDTAILAVSSSLLATVRASVTDGRPFTAVDEDRALPVALIGAAVAQTLDVASADRQPVIFIAGKPIKVGGLITDPGTQSQLLLSVVLPLATAATLPGFRPNGVEWTIRTQLGAAQQIGREAALALRPTAPGTLTSIVPPDPATLRSQVETDVRNLYLLLAGLTLFVGAVSISNAALVSVIERTAEIGLRRALGASRISIVTQFILESAILGLLGGTAGAALGVDVVAAVSTSRHWTATLDPQIALLAPALGMLVGTLGGAYPAYRAARVPPVAALRH